MDRIFARNYLKIYAFQGIALVLNLLSMFIVTPKIASVPAIYGIYVLCISVTIFFSYADLGFVSAGSKYASECFARKEPTEEARILGLVCFTIFVMVAICSIFVVFLAFNPTFLLKDAHGPEQNAIAQRLLLIIAVFSPLFVVQRFLEIVFSIRLDTYVYQGVCIIFNLAKILSIWFFFAGEKYDIVGYFSFAQVMNLLSCAAGTIIVKNRYDYDFKLLLKSFTFSQKAFGKLRSLAFSSLFGTIMWIFYYELDPFFISKMSGAKMIATYGIGLALFSFLRGLYGIIYAPFSARFNHFIGLNDRQGLKKLISELMVLTMPLTVLPSVAFFFIMDPLILCWVGPGYTASIPISRLLILCFSFGFISYPASMLLAAEVRVKELNIISLAFAAIFWIGVLATYSRLNIASFALFKLIAVYATAAYYLFVLLKYLDLSIRKFSSISGWILLEAGAMAGALLLIAKYLPVRQGAANLLCVIVLAAASCLFAFLLHFALSGSFRRSICSARQMLFKPSAANVAE
jgi:O-antigen/teichoic acid export membrane protein